MNDKPFVFWKFHAVLSVILFLIINSAFYVFYTIFPQALIYMIAMNQSLNIIAWIYMIYALKIYSNKEIAHTIAESVVEVVNEILFTDDD